MFRRPTRAEWLVVAGAAVGGVVSAVTATLLAALLDSPSRLL